MPRCGLALDEGDAPSTSRERDGSGTACHATTDDKNFIGNGNSIQIKCCNRNLLFRIQHVQVEQLLTCFPRISSWLKLKSSGQVSLLDGAQARMVSDGVRCPIIRIGENKLSVILSRINDHARRVVSSRQLSPSSTTSSETSVKAMTPTAEKASPRWLQ